ncbi:hypothetical protein [Pseudomonas sp. DWRC2-2]|uniref:hypothetical protein n=1 Tax=Pseudomonas sp. DWRC2-2 TaxID=2804567 RepID=UPI003CF0A9AE
MKISSYDIMPINDADTFEDFCCDLWKATWQSPTTQKHGRKGQAQLGVDVFGIPSGSQNYQGVQCKCRSNFLGSRLTEEDIAHEINEAKKFKPQLEHLIIATTSHSDINLQAFARAATQKNIEQGLFSVTVLGWRELLLILDEHDAVAKKYFPNMFRTDSLSKMQEALLVEENPTRLEVKDLRLELFLGDTEPYLTLEVENTSKLTAKEIELSVLIPKKEGQTQSEIIKFTPSKCIDISSIPNYSISAGSTQLIPFAPESEAHKVLSRELNTYRLVGIGLSPNIPDGLTRQIRERDHSIFFPVLSVESIGFGISLTWSSVLEQKMKTTFGAFLYLWNEADDMRYAQDAI